MLTALGMIKTGRTDIPLTARGEEETKKRAQQLVGTGSKSSTHSDAKLGLIGGYRGA